MARSTLRPVIVRPLVAILIAFAVVMAAAGTSLADSPPTTSDSDTTAPGTTITTADSTVETPAIADTVRPSGETAGDVLIADGENAGPPAHTCCEKDVKLNGRPKIADEETSVVDGNWRRVKVVVDVPIAWDCPEPRLKQQCIGIFQAAKVAGSDPLQPGNVAPMSSSLKVTKWSENFQCGSGAHKTNVRVEYTAIYPTDAAVEGEIKFEMTLPEGKGTINHSYAVHVHSKGDKLTAKPNNIDPNNPKHDAKDPVALPESD